MYLVLEISETKTGREQKLQVVTKENQNKEINTPRFIVTDVLGT